MAITAKLGTLRLPGGRTKGSPANESVTIFDHAYSPNMVKYVFIGVMLLAFVILVPGRISMHHRAAYLKQAAVANTQRGVLDSHIRLARLVQASPVKYDALQKQIVAAIPPTYTQAGMIDVLTTLAQTTGVYWTQGTPANPIGTTASAPAVSGAPGLVTLPFTVTIQGTQTQVQNYILQLQKLPLAVSIQMASTSLVQSGNTVMSKAGQPPLFVGNITAQIEAQSYTWTPPA